MDTGPHKHQDCIDQAHKEYQGYNIHQGLNMHLDRELDQRRHLRRRPLIHS